MSCVRLCCAWPFWVKAFALLSLPTAVPCAFLQIKSRFLRVPNVSRGLFQHPGKFMPPRFRCQMLTCSVNLSRPTLQPGLRRIYAESTPNLRRIYAGLAPGLRRVCAGSAPGLRRVCAGSAPGLRRVCAGFAPGLRRVCAGFTPGLRRVCAVSAPGLRQTKNHPQRQCELR